ncbi:MAG: DUF4827 domain-containing protein [Dysgonamonadaceae bacterium]|jgi:uncharacterized protein YycO|nr:DUF4827 domain-containing protein [Dysgonamonadaceae bacterium]
MRKTLIFVLTSIALLTYSLTSCDKQKSLQERLQEEKRAIDRYVKRNGLVILNEYPQNGIFGEKEYFRTSDGLYIHVVDSGNGRRATPLVDEITVRYEYRHDIAVSDSSITYWSNSALIYPFSFKYGLQQSYTVSGSLVCVGWVYPLSYVGEHAVVDLLIPSALGSAEDNNVSYGIINPVFYKGVTYTNFY